MGIVSSGECNRVISFSDVYRYSALVLGILDSIVVWGGLITWYFLRHLPHLRQRGIVYLILFVVAQTFYFIAFPLNDAISPNANILNNCFFYNIAFNMATPLAVWALTFRVLQFYIRISVNQKLSAEFDKQEKKELLPVVEEEIKRLHYYSGTRFLVILGFIVVLFSLVGGIGHSLILCELEDNECTYVTFFSPGSIVLWIIPVVLLLLFLYITFKAARENRFQDPFGILVEVRGILLYFLPVLLTGMALSDFDAGNFGPKNFPDDESEFDFRFIFYFGVLFFHIYAFPYQIYLARRTTSNTVVGDRFNFLELLQHQVGKKLFREHLIGEFGVENLNFYEVASDFMEKFGSAKSLTASSRETKETKGKQAKRANRAFSATAVDTKANRAVNIFKRFLARDQLNAVNIPGELCDRIEQQIYNPDGSSKVQISGNVFEEAREEIFNLMLNDSFHRFKRTLAYSQYIDLTKNINTPDL